jgi:hypothetical protein
LLSIQSKEEYITGAKALALISSLQYVCYWEFLRVERKVFFPSELREFSRGFSSLIGHVIGNCTSNNGGQLYLRVHSIKFDDDHLNQANRISSFKGKYSKSICSKEFCSLTQDLFPYVRYSRSNLPQYNPLKNTLIVPIARHNSWIKSLWDEDLQDKEGRRTCFRIGLELIGEEQEAALPTNFVLQLMSPYNNIRDFAKSMNLTMI